MKLSVQLFAAAREAVGQGLIEVDLPSSATVADLRRQLSRDYPALNRVLAAIRVAVNMQYVPDHQPLQGTDQVALIPPVSGG